jgi:hypothetical protein
MPSVVAVAGFLVLTVGCAELAIAKQDGLPGRRVGGGTRLDFPGQMSSVVKPIGNPPFHNRPSKYEPSK